jgi:hypothetical protein
MEQHWKGPIAASIVAAHGLQESEFCGASFRRRHAGTSAAFVVVNQNSSDLLEVTEPQTDDGD